MASGRERAIKAQKQKEFQDRQQNRRIVGQLNQQYAELKNQNPTATAEQIFQMQGASFAPTTPGAPGFAVPGAEGLGAGANDPRARGGFASTYIPSGSARPVLSQAPTWAGGREQPARGGREGMPTWYNSAAAGHLATVYGLAGLFPGVAAGISAVSGGRALQGRPQQMQARRGTVSNRAVSADTGIPDFPMLTEATQTGPQFNFNGSGGGSWWSNYIRRRGRGGGGGGGRRQPGYGYGQGGGQWEDRENLPAWYRGLANWSIG